MLSAHATDVYHFAEVVAALREQVGEVDLMTRYQWSRSSLDAFVRRVPVPRRLVRIAERRVLDDPPGVRRRRYLPASQLYYPAIGRVGSSPGPAASRAVHRRYSAAVARFTAAADVLHGTEGMSDRAFAARPDRLNILEQRNYHYAVFEQEWPVLDGFPQSAVRNPLAAVFDEEYERADLVRVYSEGVVDDFVARGFPRSRFAVVPLTASAPPRRVLAEPVPRDPHALLYVGRPDPSKGLDVAAATTRLLGAPYTLTVAGPTTKAVEAWMASQRHIRYAGILSRGELETAYSTHALLLAPSVESFGLALLEGWSAGIEVMCARSTGVAEHLPAGSVHVMADRSPERWAEAVEAMAGAGERRSGDRGTRGPVPALSADHVVRSLTAMYAAAMRSKGLIGAEGSY